MSAHLIVGGKPYCDRLGCVAGQATAARAGVSHCGYLDREEAEAARDRLAPFYCVAVEVADGPCQWVKQ